MDPACEKIQSLLAAAVEGDLDESRRAQVSEHAAECRCCAEALAFQRRLQSAITRDPLAAPPPVYFEGVLAEIHRRLPTATLRPVAGRRRPSRWAMAHAAMAALFLLWAGAGLFSSSSNSGKMLPSAPAGGARQLPQRAGQMEAHALVITKGYGLVDANSEILKPETRHELSEMGIDVKEQTIFQALTAKG